MDQHRSVLRRTSLTTCAQPDSTSLVTESHWSVWQWTSKNYDFKNHIPFPPDLEARLSPIIKHEVSWEKVYAPLGPEFRSSVGFDAWGTDYRSFSLPRADSLPALARRLTRSPAVLPLHRV